MHVVLDNLCAHSAPEITAWLSHRDRRRWHLHVTPTSSSWTNLVERWFKELPGKRLRRGRFTSVADLIEAITICSACCRPEVTAMLGDELAQARRGARRSICRVRGC